MQQCTITTPTQSDQTTHRYSLHSEVREYQPGDEIRKIDWNVTARMGHPYVKIFEEEREQTVMLLVDVSASENFGRDQVLKRNYITEISWNLKC